MRKTFQRTAVNLLFLGIINIILLTGLVLFINFQFERSSIKLREHELQQLVKIGLNQIEPVREAFSEGQLNREAALKTIADQIRVFTVEEETYFSYLFMSSYDGTVLVQPYQPEMENTNQLELVDPDGTYIIKKIIAQAKKGPGWVSYKYYPPNSDDYIRKSSYVVGLPELECYIGTGMYSTDIETLNGRLIRQTIIFIIITSLILFLAGNLIVYPIVHSFRTVSAHLERIGDGPMLKMPDINPDVYRKNSDAYLLVERIKEIFQRLIDKNLEFIEASEERNRLREEHIEIIENSLSEKDIMLKEINHRVKNNLQIIISLLKIQLTQTDERLIQEAFLETISKLESISIIHNMLYSNENYSSIPAEKYLTELIEYIIHSFGEERRISIDVMMDKSELSIDQAVPIGIITNEIITNSVKYAFNESRKGTIKIRLSTEHNLHTFSIQDDGIGLPDEYIKGKSTSLGINLIRDISRQLGKLTIDNTKGTSYRIVFK